MNIVLVDTQPLVYIIEFRVIQKLVFGQVVALKRAVVFLRAD